MTFSRRFSLRSLLLLAALESGFVAVALGQLYLYQSRNLRTITIGQTENYLVDHSLRCFENASAFDRATFHWTPSEQVTFFLQDLRDYGNAAALTIPRDLVSISIAPYSYVFETSPANERINSTINHELVHLATMDKAAGSDQFFRNIFFGKPGPVNDNPLSVFYRYLTSPRWSSPRWYIEGIAVFVETWNAGGLGRAQGAYDEMVFRTRVQEKKELYDVLAVEAEGTAVDFQAGALSYMYGTRFMSYLAYQYGPEKLIQWTTRSKGSKAYFASAFEQVYGLPLADSWQQWIQWEQQWQRANLDSVRLNPVTVDRPLAQRPLGSVSRGFLDSTGTTMYAAIRYPGQVAAVVSINLKDGSVNAIDDVKGAALYYASSVAFDPSTGTVFYTTDNNDWRDLQAVNVRTGESHRLMEDGRIGDLVFNRTDQSLWGVRHDNGFSTIVRIPPPYHEWNQVWTLPYGRDVFDLDLSPDGTRLVAGLTEISGQQKLIMFNVDSLRQGDHSFRTLFDFENNTPSNFVFTTDGTQLYGSSYYTGVSNIYRYSFATGDMDIMTNGETGYFRPLPVSADSLIAFRYTGGGFLPVKLGIQVQDRVNAIQYLGTAIVQRHPELRKWKLKAPSPSTVDVDTLNQYSKPYSPVGSIGLTSAYPIVEGYKNYTAIGWRFNFSDPILLHNMDLTVSYTPGGHLPDNERFHLTFNHRFWEWTIHASYNGGQFYDLFGPTKVTRRGYSASIQYKKYIIYDDPRTMDYTLKLAGYGNLERLPDFQNIVAPVDKFYTLRGVLTYKHFNRSIGAVDDEKGILWQLLSRNNYVQKRFLPRLSTNLDYGIALPWNHSSLWFRSSAGYSFGRNDEAFAKFYFGGFGNNWVDYQEARRYRDDYSFPGVELNALEATRYGKVLLEWTLPPIRFRNFGSPGLYSNWARLAFFSSGITTRSQVSQQAVNAGAQLDFRISFLSSFESTFSLGYAVAALQDQRMTHEFMISLKLLK